MQNESSTTSGNEHELLSLLEQVQEHERTHRLEKYDPYEFQLEFHHALGYQTDTLSPDRALMAANKVGKTWCGAAEMAYHLTGLYPDWWQGHRFDRPVRALCGSNTNDQTRDIVQAELFGEPMDEEAFGTGAIPKSCIGKKERKSGVVRAFDSVLVKHHSKGAFDGWSVVRFRGYEQGKAKHMGFPIDFGWMDEEPPQDIREQYVRGTIACGGILILTFTPENGQTQTVYNYRHDLKPGQALVPATWDDAPHLTEERKNDLLARMDPHERDMRSRGIPVIGSGLIFPVADEELYCEPFEIPHHWPRISGHDPGWTHPAALVWLAFDRDTETTYLYDCWRKSRALQALIAEASKTRGEWIPVMWPHDGMKEDNKSAQTYAKEMRDRGMNMHPTHFTNPPGIGEEEGSGGIGTFVGLQSMLNAMEEGRFKVFRGKGELFMQEKREYHTVLTKEGAPKIIRLRDDVISAARYAYQMQRFARTKPVIVRNRKPRPGLTNW